LNIGRFVVRLIVSWFLGGLVTAAAFWLVASATGQLAYGIHSGAAAVLLLFPVAVIVAFRLLARAGFPPA
jgi:hypothetical protein